jgi:hypothetical protein
VTHWAEVPASTWGFVEEGRALRDKGMEQLRLTELHDFWPSNADRAIRVLAQYGQPFSVEDVREMVGEPSRPNQWGARFMSAARNGVIERCGFTQASHAAGHARVLAMWRGTGA